MHGRPTFNGRCHLQKSPVLSLDDLRKQWGGDWDSNPGEAMVSGRLDGRGTERSEFRVAPLNLGCHAPRVYHSATPAGKRPVVAEAPGYPDGSARDRLPAGGWIRTQHARLREPAP